MTEEVVAEDLAQYISKQKLVTLYNKNQEINESVFVRNPHASKQWGVYPCIMDTLREDNSKLGTLEIGYILERTSPRKSYIAVGCLVVDENTKIRAEIHIPVGQLDKRERHRTLSDELLRLNCCTLVNVKYCENEFKNDLIPGALCLSLFPQTISDEQCIQSVTYFERLHWADGSKCHSVCNAEESVCGVTCSSICIDVYLKEEIPGEIVLENSLYLKKIKAPYMDSDIPLQFYRCFKQPHIELRYIDVRLQFLKPILPSELFKL